MSNKKQERITELTSQCMDILYLGGYKDRDCAFSIDTTWSYGSPPVYTVRHAGYVADSICKTFGSYGAAQDYLINCLEGMVEDYRK